MRIAVLSDTHMQDANEWFDAVYTRYLEPADAVLHCGDITGAPMLYYLIRHPHFYGVAGNMDRTGPTSDLPMLREMIIENIRIGITHGAHIHSPIAENLPQAFTTEQHLICFGHTHKYLDTTVGNTRILNPGSVTSPRGGVRSLAIVHAEDSKITEIEKVDLE